MLHFIKFAHLVNVVKYLYRPKIANFVVMNFSIVRCTRCADKGPSNFLYKILKEILRIIAIESRIHVDVKIIAQGYLA